MTVIESTRLAIDGGDPVRRSPLPSAMLGIQDVGQEEIDAVTDVLKRRQIFRYLRDDDESYCGRLEQAFCRFTGKKFALAVTGGTTALSSALVGLGISTGDEVIVPGYTYIATPAAVLTVGAIPVIAEVDDTLTLDPADFERKITPLTRCVIPVHMRGLPAQMDEIVAIARRHKVAVLEDCAQAVGGKYHGQALGGIGDAGIYSFQHYKVITSGEGGMVMTDDPDVYHRARYRHDSAVRFFNDQGGPDPFAGENHRMCEMRGALGLVQFGRMAGILNRTREVKQRIIAGITGSPGIAIQRVRDPDGACGITLVLYLRDDDTARRFARALSAEGISNGTIYNQGFPDRHIYKHWDYVINKWTSDRTGYPWARQYYKGSVEYSQDMCPRTLDYLGRAVAIGISQAFTDQDAQDIIDGIRKVSGALFA